MTDRSDHHEDVPYTASEIRALEDEIYLSGGPLPDDSEEEEPEGAPKPHLAKCACVWCDPEAHIDAKLA